MNRWILIFMMVCMAALGGCTGDKGKQLYDTAQFEEKQRNNEHARQLYEELVKKYPGTEFAAKATERLWSLPVK
jgi:outer membrane protein assembly factor BamD (BamD/ComL family)